MSPEWRSDPEENSVSAIPGRRAIWSCRQGRTVLNNGSNAMIKPFFLSVVVPVYKEEGNVPEFLRRIAGILDTITERYEVIFCLDPSPDRTEAVVLEHRARDPRIKLLKFSRRFGQPMATLAGLQFAHGDAVIVMDVDLQDPPELVVEMVSKWEEGHDVVYAQRRTRDGETAIKRFISWAGYKLINKVAEVNIPPNTGDFRLMSRRVIDEINRLKECHGFLRGMVALVGFNQTSILFDRPARFAGRGNYNRFLGSLRIGLNGVVCFSNYLLTFTTQIGFLVAGLSFLIAAAYALLKIFGFPFPLGNPTIVVLVLFMGGIQLISVGILGEYIARIYEEVKGRPKFIVDRGYGFESQNSPNSTEPTGTDESMRSMHTSNESN
jgi:glycosyltransferase involved in cell wall biosynthesis